ncbi:MAG: hypothetical protein RSF73_05275 [Ruthenibacterium sp.]
MVGMIWGGGFIADQLALDAKMSASLITMLRFFLAAVIMLLLCAVILMSVMLMKFSPQKREKQEVTV